MKKFIKYFVFLAVIVSSVSANAQWKYDLHGLQPKIGVSIEELRARSAIGVIGDIWYVDDDGDVGHSYWADDEFDQYRYKTGNIYRTKEEVRTALARINALADVREYILDNNLQVDNVDWSDREQEKWSIYYDHDYSEFYGGEINYIYQKLNELPWLKSEEAKDQVIQAKRKELLVIFNVK